jgi:hypothetical protein
LVLFQKISIFVKKIEMDAVLNVRVHDLDHALADDLKDQLGNAKVEIRVYGNPPRRKMKFDAPFPDK